jgi:hypothetical protein
MKGTEIKTVWIDDVDTHSPWNQRYDWCLENLGPATDSPPRWCSIGLWRKNNTFTVL